MASGEAGAIQSWNDPKAYYPAAGIPSDAPIVVRPSELARFISRLQAVTDSAETKDKPLDERERVTLLCIIGALAQETGLDLSQPMKAGDTVAAMAPELNVTGRTIGEHLKKVRAAMGSRTK